MAGKLITLPLRVHCAAGGPAGLESGRAALARRVRSDT